MEKSELFNDTGHLPWARPYAKPWDCADPTEVLNSPQSGPAVRSLLLVQFYTVCLKTKKKKSRHKFQGSLHHMLLLCQRSGWFPHQGHQSCTGNPHKSLAAECPTSVTARSAQLPTGRLINRESPATRHPSPYGTLMSSIGLLGPQHRIQLGQRLIAPWRQ